MTKANPSVLAWRTAAATAFSAMLAETLHLSPDMLKVTLSTHKSTAAVTWVRSPLSGRTEVTLYLPRMDLTKTLTREQADTLAGYWVHEAGHVLYTPEDGLRRNLAMGTGYLRLLNGLEDVRMEGCILAAAPRSNTRTALEAITRHVAIKGTDAADPIGDANEWRNISWSLAYLGRAHCHGYALGQHAAAYAATLNPTNRALIDAALDRLAKASTFEDIEALAAWVWADVYPAWDHGQQQPQQQGDQPQQQGDQPQQQGDQPQQQGDQPEGSEVAQEAPEGEGEASEGEGQGDEPAGPAEAPEGEGEGQGEASEGEGQGEASEGEGQGEASEGEGQGEGQGQGAGGTPARDDIRDAEPSVDDIAAEINATTPEDVLDRQQSSASGMEAGAAAKVRKADRSPGNADRLKPIRDAFTGVNAVRAQVRRLFEAPEFYAQHRHQEKGRFDPQAALRASWGARDIFSTAEEAPGYNTAIQVILDGSSSMAGRNIRAATGMAAHIIEVATAKACPVQVDLFRSGSGSSRGGLGMHRIIAFGERLTEDVRERLVEAAAGGAGNTPLAASIIHGTLALDTRTEPRRLLVVLTDGEDNHGPAYVSDAVALARKRGYAVAALGLGLDHSEQAVFADAFAHADAAACSDAHHLATEALRTIADALARHDWQQRAA